MEWRVIPGYPEYQVSNTGLVQGHRGILNSTSVSGGYLRINCYKDGQPKSFLVSRLVALAFIPNPEGKPEVDHINRDRADNRVENLRWATRGEQNINKTYRLSNAGHRHIRQRPDRSTFTVSIRRNKKLIYDRSFPTLSEAIQARDVFFTENDCL
jgi:hypothetical protein